MVREDSVANITLRLTLPLGMTRDSFLKEVMWTPVCTQAYKLRALERFRKSENSAFSLDIALHKLYFTSKLGERGSKF